MGAEDAAVPSVPAVRAEALRTHAARAAPAAAAALVALLRRVAPGALLTTPTSDDGGGGGDFDDRQRRRQERDAAAEHAAQILSALLAVVAAAPLSAAMLEAVGMAGLEVIFACISGGVSAAAAYESVSEDDTPPTNGMYQGALRVLTELLGEEQKSGGRFEGGGKGGGFVVIRARLWGPGRWPRFPSPSRVHRVRKKSPY